MSQIVAIVGRPNVGKSTLFNALTKTRHALVLDEEGVTRDCQYGECAWDGAPAFTLVDTAGLLSGKTEGMASVVERAAWRVIESCDIIVMVVDGAVGLTSADMALAKQLRKYHDRVILVVNKVDGQEQSWMTAEFHRLGFDPLIGIAALHNKGLQALIDALNPMLIEESNTESDEGICLTVLGRPNVGKSTLLNAILGEERLVVYDEAGTTRDCVRIPCRIQGQDYVLVDTAGVRRRKHIHAVVEKFSVIQSLKAIQQSDVVIVVLNAEEGIVEQDLRLIRRVIDAGRSLVLVINKWDTLNQETRESIQRDIDRKLVFTQFAEMITLSAIRGKGIKELFKAVKRTYNSSMKTLSTAKVNDILREAVAKHEPPVVGKFRIKLRYAHVVNERPALILIHGNQTDQLADSYKRYLISQFRQAFGLIGTPLRLQFKNSSNPYSSSD